MNLDSEVKAAREQTDKTKAEKVCSLRDVSSYQRLFD